MTPARVVRVTVNGETHERLVEVRKSLADFLRQDLELTGTHLGCEHGVCGACTVLLDGQPVRSCLLFAVQVDNPRARSAQQVARAARRLSFDTQESGLVPAGLQDALSVATPRDLICVTGSLSIAAAARAALSLPS